MKGTVGLLIAISAAAPAAAAPPFDMTAFFTGRTHSDNVLRIALHGAVPLIVDSVGRLEGQTFVLVDTIHEGDKPVRTRKWVVREVAPRRYSGTLSDATGPLEIVVKGGNATVRYTMKGGLKVEQKLQPQRDGRTLTNRVVVRKFGLRFGTVEGTVRKLD